jgi:hypothetical protein
MNQVYAKILNGIVVNMQIATSTDYFDPTYVWVVITTQVCTDGSAVQTGCTYDGTNFNPPSGD